MRHARWYTAVILAAFALGTGLDAGYQQQIIEQQRLIQQQIQVCM